MTRIAVAILLLGCLLVACSPEMGSESWCEEMDEKPQGDWTANDAGEYAKSCIFRATE